MPRENSRTASDVRPLAASTSMVADAMRGFISFSASEIRALHALEKRPQRVRKGVDLVIAGQKRSAPFVILEGYVMEYRQDASGRRQALDLLLPGEIANLRSAILSETDTSMIAITDAIVSRLKVDEFHDIIARHPRLGAAFIWRAAVGRSFLAEHLVDVGRRNAYQRLGHRLLELLVRMEWVGLSKDDTLAAPLDLTMLGDMLGLSIEHVSRTLGKLRKEGLVAMKGGRISILDRRRLAEVSEFDRSYLHLAGPPRQLDSRYQ